MESRTAGRRMPLRRKECESCEWSCGSLKEPQIWASLRQSANAAKPNVDRMYSYTSLDRDTGWELQKDVSLEETSPRVKLVCFGGGWPFPEGAVLRMT